MEWAKRAACQGVEPEVFFPVGSGALKDTRAAKAICSACPVILDCRDYAERSRQPFGVWGGLDEDERRMSLTGRVVPASA